MVLGKRGWDVYFSEFVLDKDYYIKVEYFFLGVMFCIFLFVCVKLDK